MHLVEPKVFLVAESKIDHPELKSALRDIGGGIAEEWFERVENASESDGELLTEVAGRACYKSYGVGLNPNVKRIREDSGEYLSNTLSKGDGSIFEHTMLTFVFVNVSRVFTHELVRHRVGVAISQESKRYVREVDIGVWVPPGQGDLEGWMVESAQIMEQRYREKEASYDWDSMTFDEKKAKTSALRRMLPEGRSTVVVWSVNLRELRHILNMRTSEGAEVEMRFVFDKVADIVKERFPLVFKDFESKQIADGTKSWKPQYAKA
ncbi:MAG: FAD-dependent thymidylate synthase [Candidatus Micrarchaeota archaeon]|nr:FAD-dependent thymidylate synthase [Candidatus Micrarchaeota archaeon]